MSEMGDSTGNSDFLREGWCGCEGRGVARGVQGLLAQPASGMKGEESGGGQGEEDEERGARRAGGWGVAWNGSPALPEFVGAGAPRGGQWQGGGVRSPSAGAGGGCLPSEVSSCGGAGKAGG